jgi:hypothetical protein
MKYICAAVLCEREMHPAYIVRLHAQTRDSRYASAGIGISPLPIQIMVNQPGGRAIYKIGIAGDISCNWRDYMEAVSVMREVDEHQNATTILTCEILDQAQLLGILNMLYGWGSRLIWLHCVPMD